ncbi:MAG: hypothetical protein ABIP95_01815 [Pelobium sp.]
MESLTIEIIDPKVKKLLEDLADLNLISISKATSINNDGQEWNSLTKEQQQGIFDASNSIKMNRGIPHEKVMSNIRKKLLND